jgi:concanavalin A-like lectin/glucanase superfamily protein
MTLRTGILSFDPVAGVLPTLEFSTDPLSVSNAAATWQDVTRYCISADWQSGTTREFDDPQAGQATFVLKNSQRRFEPEYAAGAYYPNIVPGRRFRLTLTADGFSYQQGIWYAQSWQVEYPAGTTYSTVTVTCSDGFWRLALKRLNSMSPASAESLSDVIQSDNPFAYYPLNEASQSKTAQAVTGPQGSYRGSVDFGLASPVVGANESAPTLHTGAFVRAKLDDEQIWNTSGQVTIECVINVASFASFNRIFIGGPFDTTAAGPSFSIASGATSYAFGIYNVGAVLTAVALTNSTGTHHLAMTYDGSKLSAYIDGALSGTADGAGNIISPDNNEFLYIGSNGHGSPDTGDFQISDAAYYDYALPATRIQAHADAALNRGYTAQPSGTRIAALATDSLWSTAGIPAGTVTAQPRFQVGQSTLDEITETTKIEQPGSFFYFDDTGNPDYRALQDTQQVSATFGDTTSEIQYDSINLVYNDELFNSATVSGDGLTGATAQNTSSISDYGLRAQDATGLIITNQADARLLSQAIVDRFATPAFRVDSITLNAADADARAQILAREVGDTIRIRRRGEGGTAIDIITRILQKQKHLATDAHLTCTWTLARGFSAVANVNHLGVSGYNQLDVSFILS